MHSMDKDTEDTPAEIDAPHACAYVRMARRRLPPRRVLPPAAHEQARKAWLKEWFGNFKLPLNAQILGHFHIKDNARLTNGEIITPPMLWYDKTSMMRE